MLTHLFFFMDLFYRIPKTFFLCIDKDLYILLIKLLLYITVLLIVIVNYLLTIKGKV